MTATESRPVVQLRRKADGRPTIQLNPNGGRKANHRTTETIAAKQLHANDILVGTAGATLWVEAVTTRNGQTTVTLRDGKSWTVNEARPVVVLTEHECDCNGSGIYYGHGVVENGVFKGTTGPHFACAGKGWQSRSDVIRNKTYWDKYARISL